MPAIVQALTATLGSTHTELFSVRANNPFRKGPGVPWTKVNEQSADMNSYIQQHLSNPYYAKPVAS